MNHLLHQITWHQYLVIALIAAIIYYLVVILRCYQPELRKIKQHFSGNQNREVLQALQYQDPETETPAPITQVTASQQNNAGESINENDILTGKLKACIAKAADKPFAPSTLILQLNGVLQQHKDLAITARPAINHLIVKECEKTGTALLTDDEVDQWWES
jgi:hypothetical protein